MLAEHGQLSASAIGQRFRTTPSAISQHLKVLREARMVEVEKRNQQRLYTLNPDAVRQLEEWARQMSARYDALETMLEEDN